MRSTTLSLAVAAITGAGLLLAAPAAAHTGGSQSALILTMANGSQAADVPLSDHRYVVLACDPAPSGNHPDAEGACATLESVSADLTAVPQGHGLCTLQYAPVTVTAEGYWRGERVDYGQEFSNACVAGQETGGVFGF